jgi:hypothetical protein
MKSNKDITILFLTANKVPKQWAEYQKKILLEAAGDASIISLSRQPIDLGTNVLDTDPEGISNIYLQMLKGARMATTPYIAVAEDDALYHYHHFAYRPPMDVFAYNMNRWGIFTWEVPPTYFWKNRISNSTLIASRELTIEALEERFAKYPNGTPPEKTGELGRNKIEKRLGITYRKSLEFLTVMPVVRFDHDWGLDPLERNHKKRMAFIRAFDIPHWGRAEELVKHFY